MHAFRTIVFGALLVAAGAALWGLAIRPLAQAQTAAAADGIIQVIANMNEREQVLYHIDTAKQKILVYQLSGQTAVPELQLLAVRDYRYDIEVDAYNNAGLQTFEVQKMVIQQEKRDQLEREARELRAKKGLPVPKEEELPPPPAIPAVGGTGQVLAVVGNIRKDEQVLYMTHTGKRRLCIYWFHTSTKKLEFIAARNIEWDIDLRLLNTVGPTPDDINRQIQIRKRRWEDMQKNGGVR